MKSTLKITPDNGKQECENLQDLKIYMDNQYCFINDLNGGVYTNTTLSLVQSELGQIYNSILYNIVIFQLIEYNIQKNRKKSNFKNIFNNNIFNLYELEEQLYKILYFCLSSDFLR